ncbi:MAG: hypothetical protein Q4Q20_06185, partial [Methanocorpusculum sp.]|nr:hypothetical protein [Methanocorpusculum sp.]
MTSVRGNMQTASFCPMPEEEEFCINTIMSCQKGFFLHNLIQPRQTARSSHTIQSVPQTENTAASVAARITKEQTKQYLQYN